MGATRNTWPNIVRNKKNVIFCSTQFSYIDNRERCINVRPPTTPVAYCAIREKSSLYPGIEKKAACIWTWKMACLCAYLVPLLCLLLWRSERLRAVGIEHSGAQL